MKRSVLLFLVTVLLLSTFGCSESRTTQETIDSANAYREQGDLGAAVAELKNALRQTPDNAEVRNLLGAVYSAQGDFEGAEKEYLRTVDLGVAYPSVVIPVLRARLAQAKHQEILDDLVDEQMLSEDQLVELWVLRGHAHFELSDFDVAQKMYDRALALNGTAAEALLGRALVAGSRESMSAAREWLDQAFLADINYAPAWCFLGDIEFYLQHYKAAETAYSRALEAQPNNVQSLANRALVRLSLKNLPGAVKDLNAARRANVAQAVKSSLVTSTRGQIRLAQKDYTAAAAVFEQLLKAAPDHLSGRYYLAVAQYHLGNLEQSLQNVRECRNKAPRFVGAHRLYAAIQFSQGHYTAAEEAVETVLSFDADDSWALNLKGEIAVLQGGAGQSIGNYRKLAALPPDSTTAQLHLFEEAQQLRPGNQ